jgi:NADH-quinone oxidoreductase subunit K
MLPINHYLFLSIALLLIGVIGALTRRNLLIKLFSIELILTAATINLAAFSRLFADLGGQTFAIFTIALIAIETLVAIGILTAAFRRWQPDRMTSPESATESANDRAPE